MGRLERILVVCLYMYNLIYIYIDENKRTIGHKLAREWKELSNTLNI